MKKRPKTVIIAQFLENVHELIEKFMIDKEKGFTTCWNIRKSKMHAGVYLCKVEKGFCNR